MKTPQPSWMLVLRRPVDIAPKSGLLVYYKCHEQFAIDQNWLELFCRSPMKFAVNIWWEAVTFVGIHPPIPAVGADKQYLSTIYRKIEGGIKWLIKQEKAHR
jgi:hypothetical protein